MFCELWCWVAEKRKILRRKWVQEQAAGAGEVLQHWAMRYTAVRQEEQKISSRIEWRKIKYVYISNKPIQGNMNKLTSIKTSLYAKYINKQLQLLMNSACTSLCRVTYEISLYLSFWHLVLNKPTNQPSLYVVRLQRKKEERDTDSDIHIRQILFQYLYKAFY